MMYDNIILTIHDQRFPPVGVGYYYTLQSNGMNHRAFFSKKSLKKWTKERKLKFSHTIGIHIPSQRLPTTPFIKSFVLKGKYARVQLMLNSTDFFKCYGGYPVTSDLDNGDLVIAFIYNGVECPIIYLQNPNTDRFRLDRSNYDR